MKRPDCNFLPNCDLLTEATVNIVKKSFDIVKKALPNFYKVYFDRMTWF